MKSGLYDNHGRLINYLRIAVTDRCNLRCAYCMPEEGIRFGPKNSLLQYEEILRLVRILAGMGIEKIRVTGGEPFVRREIMDLFRGLTQTPGIAAVHLTTNGTLTAPHLPELFQLGVRSINLSLDSLDPSRFFAITRRDSFDQVWRSFLEMLALGFEVKINAVLLQGKNDQDILPFVEMTRQYPVSVRFIEEMPFNGQGKTEEALFWNWQRIEQHIRAAYPDLKKMPDPPHSTALNYSIPGHLGSIGIIPAFSRTFCGSCNRLRVTPEGLLKTCLYDDGVFNLRDLMRAGATDLQIQQAIQDAVGHRAKDGFEAESRRLGGMPVRESMTTIGG